MALKLKYKDEHGVVQINMSPTSSPKEPDKDLTGPKFDTINNRFAQYDLFGGKYDVDSGGETPRSLFRSRYNSIEEELANTPYAFTTDRSLRLNSANKLDITIQSRDETSPSKDIQDDRFFKRRLSLEYDESLFGPQIDFKVNDSGTPAFTVTQLIHAQDRYFDLSGRQSESPCGKVCSEVHVPSPKRNEEAFRVLSADVKSGRQEPVPVAKPAVPTSKRKKETSFAILAETPVSRPTSPRSLPVDIRTRRVSPFRGRGFREETSRHNTPRTSAANSRANSPPRRRTNSLSRIDNMAQTATLPLPIHNLPRPHSPRNFLKENIEEVRELSELNREKHEAEAERKRIEEEEAILKEMGVLDKSKSGSRSVVGSRTNSRSNSPSKINLRSRDNSPSAILHYENIPANSREFVNADDGIRQPVTHRSRVRSVSKSQPQSNNGSPKHSKIPKRQSSVSPTRTTSKPSVYRQPFENNLNKNQRFISSSTSSIHETIRIGSQVHDKRGSKSTQHLSISPAHIKGKPPISPGRGGPPPSNRVINAKRLSPIVGTPNKSPIDDLKPNSARPNAKPTPVPRKSVKTAGNTPATSRLNSRQPSRTVSRDPSPDKRKTKTVTKPVTSATTKPVSRVASTRTTQKPTTVNKPEPKKPVSRTNSMKSLTRTPSTKNLAEKPPLKKNNSKKDLSEKAQSTSKINEVGTKKDSIKKKDSAKGRDETDKGKVKSTRSTDSMTDSDNVSKQDNETQYDKITNEKGELVIMTKKNIISMTTAAITSQPLELVSTVTNQLPAAFEKAREKGIFERLSSKDSLVGKEDTTNEKPVNAEKDKEKPQKHKDASEEKEKVEEKKPPPRHNKPNNHDKPLYAEDQVKLKLLQGPFNNPQIERAKQKIEAILKEPEISTENILTASAKTREVKNTFKEVADNAKTEVKEAKDEAANKLTEIKDQVVKQNEKMTEEIRSEVTKIVDSIITPVEEPKDVPEKKEKVKDVPKKMEEVKKDIIEPIVTVVNEKKKNGGAAIAEKVNETLVKGEGEVEVLSSNVSTPGVDKIRVQKKDGNGSDKSAQSNGGFPQSTSTTPKPPARTKKEAKETPPPEQRDTSEPVDAAEDKPKEPNFCQRLMKKCKTKCCACCTKGEESEEDGDKDKERQKEEMKEEKKGMMSKLNCCKKQVDEEKAEQEVRDLERAAGKASIEYENETKPKRTLRDVFCGCCGRRRRVADTGSMPRNVAESMSPAPEETGCFAVITACVRGCVACVGDTPSSPPVDARACSPRTRACRLRYRLSLPRQIYSRNPNYPITMQGNNKLRVTPVPSPRPSIQVSPRGTPNPSPIPSRKASRILITKDFMKKDVEIEEDIEDTRTKLDTSLVEHTSVMRGAIPVLPIVLAYFCLFCNIVIPGLGSFVINLLVGCGQLFTVLFCLVGWGWSIWWGVIMVKTSRKYRKLKREAEAAEAEAAPPVTTNNHTRA
ncbi:unnamed protein product [Spodoptera littoralis]|uniref:Uncharacterized protein n=1 Tax=Spodoptera littoralis TaxID=7109 RepID=A0A9P0N2S5_SPOLI|nr:unnamed protein product [Spodoptera littoralis]CAH1642571.1 unnamed protein product [Spodoptera littoralis]